MLSYSPPPLLDLSDLIDSDETPVDNEDQNLIPNLLLLVLLALWKYRIDWYFGVDMALFHPFKENPREPIVPDAFLALNVERRPHPEGRRSYRVWDERQVPVLALEMISHKYNQEFEEKKEEYARLGVRYYVVYTPAHLKRQQHDCFEVYQLNGSCYTRLSGDPVWLEDVGLGIGTGEIDLGAVQIPCLLWFNQEEVPYYLPVTDPAQIARLIEQDRHRMEQLLEQERQRTEQERQRAEQERQKNEKLQAYLRSLGLDPTTFLEP